MHFRFESSDALRCYPDPPFAIQSKAQELTLLDPPGSTCLPPTVAVGSPVPTTAPTSDTEVRILQAHDGRFVVRQVV